jgi:hypothetical protein
MKIRVLAIINSEACVTKQLSVSRTWGLIHFVTKTALDTINPGNNLPTVFLTHSLFFFSFVVLQLDVSKTVSELNLCKPLLAP